MNNNFIGIDAQDEIARLAQITFDELEMPFELTEEGKQLNAANWSMLEEIHGEVAPVMANLRFKEDMLDNL